MEELRYMRPAPLQPVSLAAPFYAPPPVQAPAPMKRPLVRLFLGFFYLLQPCSDKHYNYIQTQGSNWHTKRHCRGIKTKKHDSKIALHHNHLHHPQSWCKSLLREVIDQYRYGLLFTVMDQFGDNKQANNLIRYCRWWNSELCNTLWNSLLIWWGWRNKSFYDIPTGTRYILYTCHLMRKLLIAGIRLLIAYSF